MSKTRFNKKDRKAAAEVPPNEHKRQQGRRELRKQAFAEISGQYGGESRRNRRSMAKDLGKRRYGAKTDVRA